MRGLRFIAIMAVAILALSGAALAATAGDFNAVFNGVSYDTGAGTSTWTYTLTWHKTYQTSPGLSHFNIELCPDAEVLSASPEGYTVGIDGSLLNDKNTDCFPTSMYSIKWDMTIPPDTPTVFTFTLNGLYAVGDSRFAAKAANLCNIGNIEGPSLSCAIADPKIDVQKTCLPDVFVGDMMTFVVTVINNGNVSLSNVAVDDAALDFHQVIPSLPAGGQAVFTLTKTAVDTGVFPNTASASGTYYGWTVSDTDSCSTNVWALSVSKTAVTTFHRDYDWSAINVPVNGTPTEVCHGQTKPVPFRITVTKTSQDSGWTASGNVVVSNPSPIAVLVSLQDQLSNGTGVPLNCGVTLPYMLPGGATITCSYSIGLPSGDSLINNAVATIPNGTSFNGTAPVDFSSFTSSDPGTTVYVTVDCPVGFQCTGGGPWNVTDSGTIDYDVNVTNVDALCDSSYSLGTTAGWVDDSVTETSGATAGIKTCKCATGCTLTIGYWKTHAGFTGNNPDRVTQYLPIWLGQEYVGKSVEVANREKAVTVLSMELGTSSNGITKLYAQLLGAKLNMARGASSEDIVKTVQSSDAFLANYNWLDWAALSKANRSKVISWMSLLDGYNNGLIGPGHCD